MSAITGRLQAQLADRYRIERPLGAGGMATVYLAEDIKHHRRVALKVLRPELSAVLGTERFLKEIEVTANLQHPHLLPLFDSGEADGLLYYVMPYVEGESLRQRLGRERQLSVDEAVRIATQVSTALQYAHKHGVVHRDIKPENILLHDGQAQVADFGIALALRQAGGNRLTQTGLSLGTPQYMSPEQAMGEQNVDHRADIYALGAVLYEMLSGEPPFTGATAQAIVARVLSSEPTLLGTIRRSVPPNVEGAVHQAIARVPADRFAAVEEFARALNSTEWVPTAVRDRHAVMRVVSRDWRQRAAIPLAVAVVVFMTTSAWLWIRSSGTVAGSPVAAVIPTPRPTGDEGGSYRFFDVTRDGLTLAYSQGTEGIALRPVGSPEATTLPDTRRGVYPTFSPDGKQLAFTVDGVLYRMPIAGGARTEVARVWVAAGMDWGDDGFFYFASGLGTAGIWRVAAGGGTPEPVTRVRDDDMENAHTWPQLLPGGGALIYTALGPSGGASDSRVVAQRIGSEAHTVLIEKAMYGRFLPTGHLLYAHDDGTLYAVRFERDRLAVEGEPAAVQSGVGTGTWSGAAFVAVSTTGTAVYLPRSDRPGLSFMYADRTGRIQSSAIDTAARRRVGPGAYGIRLSPDGQRMALTGRSPGSVDIWVVTRGMATERLTLDVAEDESAEWSPDGQAVTYTSAQTGMTRRVLVKEVGVGRAPRLVRTWPRHVHVTSWSRDGRWLALADYTQSNSQDVWAISLDGKDSIAIAVSPASEKDGVFSPDGRWLVYSSDESGRFELFAVSFPSLTVRRQLTTSGASSPRWDASGRQVYYLSGRAVVSLPVNLASGLRTGTETVLFKTSATGFDVSPDGQRFLLQVPNETPDHPPLHIRTNWFEAIRAKVK